MSAVEIHACKADPMPREEPVESRTLVIDGDLPPTTWEARETFYREEAKRICGVLDVLPMGTKNALLVELLEREVSVRRTR